MPVWSGRSMHCQPACGLLKDAMAQTGIIMFLIVLARVTQSHTRDIFYLIFAHVLQSPVLQFGEINIK